MPLNDPLISNYCPFSVGLIMATTLNNNAATDTRHVQQRDVYGVRRGAGSGAYESCHHDCQTLHKDAPVDGVNGWHGSAADLRACVVIADGLEGGGESAGQETQDGFEGHSGETPLAGIWKVDLRGGADGAPLPCGAEDVVIAAGGGHGQADHVKKKHY
jgi:hypothetical protein